MSNTTITPNAGAVGIASDPQTAAVIAPATQLRNFTGGEIALVWAAMVLGAVGAAAPSPSPAAAGLDSVCFAAEGAFGSGGTLTIQGSNDGVTWTTLTTIPAFTAPGVSQPISLRTGPKYLRPVVTAGDTTTNISVSALLT
ncbi:MAG: hypothetical protein JSS29_11045 [Proteobacteria bacterium]|nr:hypothetical protein [Pseudomonadota bacterium]